MAEPKIFSIQPRFKIGDQTSGWSMVESIFNLGSSIPHYGSDMRDGFLSFEWQNEPMIAGVFSTWIEKAQTINWKITGGRNNANQYARMLQAADDGAGWSYHEGVCAQDYLTTDKGSVEEVGRESLTPALVKKLREVSNDVINKKGGYEELDALINEATYGKITGIQQLDTTRLIKFGLPRMRWRYYPEVGEPTSIPDENLIQITSMPSGRDRFRGFGFCPLSRCVEAKNLMAGYIRYFRQEIGDLPMELIAIVNGMPQSDFETVLQKYKIEKKQRGMDEYGGIMWLGSDDPMTPIEVKTISLVNNTKSFNWVSMIEWWLKTLSVNVGEDVGEFWLMQRGESKTVQSIQAMKSKGKGVARYLQEKERLYNLRIMPVGVRFEYDNQDDDSDKLRNDILAIKVTNLKELAAIGVDRQDPAYTMDQIRNIAKQWDIIPPEVSGEEVPAVLGAMLKEISEETWEVHSDLREIRQLPLLRSDRDISSAQFLYNHLKEVYGSNGFIKHQPISSYVPAL